MTALLTTLTDVAKRLVRHVVHDYRLNWIFASDATGPVPKLPEEIDFAPLDDTALQRIATTTDPQFRKVLGYERIGASGFLLSKHGEPLSAAHFVDQSLYENATIWPLGPDEAALLNVVTLDAAQGYGYAPILIAHATAAMLSPRYRRAIAFIWWNHRASLCAFTRAGWHRIGFSIGIVGKNGAVRHVHIPVPKISRRRAGLR
ncbi:hypothetical protein AB5I39_00135 [Sphingomonas sp. MMS24-J45]|uniref:hypothetical protein n=1 Tax=Sphingomonas sp. MMS24-J45 TaxID=3238806 RepID=UPI00384AB06C